MCSHSTHRHHTLRRRHRRRVRARNSGPHQLDRDLNRIRPNARAVGGLVCALLSGAAHTRPRSACRSIFPRAPRLVVRTQRPVRVGQAPAYCTPVLASVQLPQRRGPELLCVLCARLEGQDVAQSRRCDLETDCVLLQNILVFWVLLVLRVSSSDEEAQIDAQRGK